jgi:transcriptional regulator with XRE-family HTH domain
LTLAAGPSKVLVHAKNFDRPRTYFTPERGNVNFFGLKLQTFFVKNIFNIFSRIRKLKGKNLGDKFGHWNFYPMDTLGNRLKIVRGSLSQSSVAQRLDVPQTTWSNYEKGRNQPNLALIDKICGEFGVNLEWLLFGRGTASKSSETEPDICPNCVILYDKLVRVQERENALLKENSLLRDKIFALERKLAPFAGGAGSEENTA